MSFELKKMNNQNVLITGGLGFIGSNLAIKCLELGANVFLFTDVLEQIENIKEIKDNPKLKIMQGSIALYDDIERAIKEKDIVFHLAAQTSHFVSMENPILDIDINLIGTMNVLEACRKTNPSAKIVSLGTVSQSGIAKILPIDETHTDWPIEIYSANKLICEKYFQIYHKAYGLHTAFLRLGTLFGERQRIDSAKRGITNFFIGKILRGEPITVYGDGKFIRDYIHVSNVIDALILSAQDEKAKGHSFLLGSDRMYFIDMVKGVAEAVEKLAGKKANIVFVPFPEGEKKIDVGNTTINYSKIKNLLGWEPKVNFKEGIERTVKHYV